MTDRFLTWLLDQLGVTPSREVLWILVVVVICVLVTPLARYIFKRFQTARENGNNMTPAIGMAICVGGFLVCLFWDMIINSKIKPKIETAQSTILPAGKGGDAGDARVERGEGGAKGGTGGKGGAVGGGDGGKGGSATVIDGKGSAIAGDGGDAGKNPGDGGQGGASAWSKMVAANPTLQRVALAQKLIDEYKTRSGSAATAANGSEVWVNGRLKELGQSWYIKNTASGFEIIDTPPAKQSGLIDWEPDFFFTVSGAGRNAKIYAWYIRGKSPAFVTLQDAYIISKLTGHKDQLSVYTPAFEKMSLDEIEPVPPNAPIQLGVQWQAPLSVQEFLQRWGRIEFVVSSDNQKFTKDFDEDYIRSRVGVIIPGALGPEITKKKGTE